MSVVFRWLRLSFSFVFFITLIIVLANYNMAVYLCYQAKGQLSVLTHTQPLSKYASNPLLSAHEKANIQLIEKIKNYSVDSLGYLPTQNYTTVFVPKVENTLWVITACKPYEFTTYNWKFPIVGEVSYKGFFNKPLAEKEYNHLVSQGFDVDLRSVSAWSTLGWFNDPLIDNMLRRSKAGLSNLLFHELFHATYYAPSSVNLNENLANFVADKATLRFLKNDTSGSCAWFNNQEDYENLSRYMLIKKAYLTDYYKQIQNNPNRQELKLKAIYNIADSIQYLPLHTPKKFMSRKSEILKFKNAYFVDFQQYESLQDSLEKVFNKFYGGDIKIFIEYLKLNKIYY